MTVNKLFLNQKGQTLIFVLLIMTVALAIGIAISSRTISTVRRTTNLDTSARALSAAEAAVEYYLTRSSSELDTLSGYPPTGSNPSNVTTCTPTSTPATRYPSSGYLDQDLNTFANVGIQRVGCMQNDQTFTIEVAQDKILELKTDNGSDGTASFQITVNSPTDVGLYFLELYSQSGQVQVRKRSVNLNNSTIISATSSNTPTTVSSNAYSYQTQVAGAGPSIRPLLVRILPLKSVAGKTSITIRNTSNYTLPYQGHRITATGFVGSSQNSVNRAITAVRTIPALPTIFNFGVYANTSIN